MTRIKPALGRRARRLLVACAAVLCAASLPALPRAAPLEAYGRLPAIERASISGDGQTLAFISNDGGVQAVIVRAVGDSKPKLTLKLGAGKLRSLRWAGADHLFITGSFTGTFPWLISPRSEWFEVIDVNVKARTVMNLLGGAANAVPAVIGAPQVRTIGAKTYAFVQAAFFVNDVGRVSLFRVDLTNGTTSPVAVGSDFTDGWLAGKSGGLEAESRYDPGASSWTLLAQRDGRWRTVDSGSDPFGDGTVLGLGRDGRSVLLGVGGDGHDRLRELAPGATVWGDSFAVPNAGDLIFDPTDERLIGDHDLASDLDHYIFFDPADQARWDAAAAAFPGARVTLSDLTADHGKLLVEVDAPSAGPSYAIVDAATRAITSLGAAYPQLSPDDIATVAPVAFAAADGTPLTGYLTLPRGKDPRSLPLVVFPHGGPAARDEPGFDWWPQAMASQGYAVLQVNYRGSDGFGDQFREAGYGEWGRKMQTDLSDGVRYLAAQGTIDPKRVCIVGASYGGYAALAGVTLDPGVYRCAVAVAGISDLHRFVGWSGKDGDVAVQRYWTRYVGASGPNDPLLTALSPVSHVDAVTAPVLLVHGKDDTVVPFNQSQMMADALKKAGKRVDFVILNHEDHWLSRGETRLQMLQATIDFLIKNNPPG